ncbi:MAG: hypothetical protein LBM73_03190, partial [Candidatus Nomurabacteria bacterium]|nr:hypothetical protein [Candidatus Nomurabacteria bacterium]
MKIRGKFGRRFGAGIIVALVAVAAGVGLLAALNHPINQPKAKADDPSAVTTPGIVSIVNDDVLSAFPDKAWAPMEGGSIKINVKGITSLAVT